MGENLALTSSSGGWVELGAYIAKCQSITLHITLYQSGKFTYF